MKTNPANILVIERHPMLREALCAAIEAEEDLGVMGTDSEADNSFPVLVTSTHDVLFLANKPDIILLAIGNPGLEDLKALRRLHGEWYGTPILALTSDEVPDQEQAALANGAQAALGKSSSRSELLKALRSLMRES